MDEIIMSDDNDGYSAAVSTELNLEDVLAQIYENCDVLGTGTVAVSKLIEFIKPFMEDKECHLNSLKVSLDPSDCNPEITKQVFDDAMSNWIKEFDNEDNQQVLPSELDCLPMYVEHTKITSGIVQFGDIVEEDETCFQDTTVRKGNFMEKYMLEDEIKQLSYESKKYSDELLLVRSQLINQEEQNLILQREIEKLSLDLKRERESSEKLLVEETKLYEEIGETAAARQKTIDKLKKNLLHFEKENQQLKTQNSSLDYERQKSADKLTQIHEKLTKTRKEILELRSELNMKTEQLSLADELKQSLLTRMHELNDINEHLKEANSCLRVEKDKVNFLLQERIRKQSQTMVNSSSQNTSRNLQSVTMVLSQIGYNSEESGNDEDIIASGISTSGDIDNNVSLKEELDNSFNDPDSSSSLRSVQNKLDYLFEQIKNETTSLHSLEEKLECLMESQQSVNDVKKSFESQVLDLKKIIELAQYKEDDLMKKCAENSEKIATLLKHNHKLERTNLKLGIENEELVLLKHDLRKVQKENERLLKANLVDEDIIERLKTIELQVQTCEEEKTKLIEENNNNFEKYAKDTELYKTDFFNLEQKCFASHQQIVSLLAEIEGLKASNANLFLQNQQLRDGFNSSQGKLHCIVQIIDEHNLCSSSSDLTLVQKVQSLVVTNNKYNELQLCLNQTIQEKEKCIVELKAMTGKIKELEEAQRKSKVMLTSPKKAPHDRVQIKMEKLRAQVDHLNDCLNKEKTKQAGLQHEFERSQKCNKFLVNEKASILKELNDVRCNLSKEKKDCGKLLQKVRILLSNGEKLRKNMLRFSNNWRVVLDQIDSVNVLVQQLVAPPITMEVIADEIVQCQNEMYVSTLILDTLAGFDINKLILSGDENEKSLKAGVKQLSRPASPDSPTLDCGRAAQEVTSPSGAGDSTTVLHYNEDMLFSEECVGDEVDNLESDDNDFEGFYDPFEDLHKMYPCDDYSMIISSLGWENPLQQVEQSLEAYVDEFVLLHMIDCTGHKNRLQGQIQALQEVVTRLVEHLQTFATTEIDIKPRKSSMGGIVHCIFELTKSAELYGAILQEIKSSQPTSKLIKYISTLREVPKIKMAACKAHKLRGETVFVDNIISCPCSDPCGVGSSSSQGRVMSLLEWMSPRNLLRMVGALAFAFFVYYFSQRFFLLAETDGEQRDPICWVSWRNFLAACFGREHEDAIPSI